MFACSNVVNAQCSEWVEISDSLSFITLEQGLEIGGLFLLVSCLAWGFREVARFILNRK